MATRIFIRLRLAWQRVRGRLSSDRGSYSADVAVTTSVLLAGAVVIGGALILFGEDLVNAFDFGPAQPGQP